MNKILFSLIVAASIFIGCSDEKVETTTQNEETKAPQEKFVTQTKESAAEVAATIVEESKKVAQAGSEAVKDMTNDVIEKSKEIKEEAVKSVNQTKDKIEDSINSIVEAKSAINDESTTMLDKGKALYLKCAGCHGASAEKPALGKSLVIKGWSKEQIVSALEGYKNGTYGAVMKGVMKSQVSSMTKEDIEAVSAYIATF
ncbi:c-type cytochrome [Halarcobacter ebronensis]|nr:c-type cytochrome [Halarcobacter ebronensis]